MYDLLLFSGGSTPLENPNGLSGKNDTSVLSRYGISGPKKNWFFNTEKFAMFIENQPWPSFIFDL